MNGDKVIAHVDSDKPTGFYKRHLRRYRRRQRDNVILDDLSALYVDLVHSQQDLGTEESKATYENLFDLYDDEVVAP